MARVHETVSVDRSTIWPYDSSGDPQAFFYTRYAHPTGTAAEHALGEREGGNALLYGSGTAAATAVLLSFAKPGMTIALAEGAYFGTSILMRELGPWGLELVEYDQTGPPPAADIVWVESPANPTLSMPSWEALQGCSSLVVCDATISTPVFLRALDAGADIVIHSATKFLTGHHNALLGATITRDPTHTERLLTIRGRVGLPASPDAAGALLRGLETLDERMAQITASATEIARRLEGHARVSTVRYPGFSGLISFDVADPRLVETRTRLITNATSLGGVVSTMESRHRWEGDRIPEGLLRLSVGLESVEDLWEDLTEALS